MADSSNRTNVGLRGYALDLAFDSDRVGILNFVRGLSVALWDRWSSFLAGRVRNCAQGRLSVLHARSMLRMVRTLNSTNHCGSPLSVSSGEVAHL